MLFPWPWSKLGPIETPSFSLRSFATSEAEIYRSFLLELRSEDQLVKFLGLSEVCSVEHYRKTLGQAGYELYGVWRRASGEFAGTCGFLANSFFVTAPEIFIWLRKFTRGQGAGPEIARHLLMKAFGQWDCDVVIGVPHPENEPSLGLLRKLRMPQCASIVDPPTDWDNVLKQKKYTRFPIHWKFRSQADQKAIFSAQGSGLHNHD